jgi:hypothetical protein
VVNIEVSDPFSTLIFNHLFSNSWEIDPTKLKDNHNLSLLQALNDIFSAIRSVQSDIMLGVIYSALLG